MFDLQKFVDSAEDGDIGSALSLIGFLTLFLESQITPTTKEQSQIDPVLARYFIKAFRSINEGNNPIEALYLQRSKQKLRKADTEHRNCAIAREYFLRRPNERSGISESLLMELASDWGVGVEVVRAARNKLNEQMRKEIVQLKALEDSDSENYANEISKIKSDISIRKKYSKKNPDQ